MTDIQLTAENRKSINSGINEWINSKTRASAESELQKEIIEKIHTETGLDKKLIKKFAMASYKGKVSDTIEESETFAFLVENL